MAEWVEEEKDGEASEGVLDDEGVEGEGRERNIHSTVGSSAVCVNVSRSAE